MLRSARWGVVVGAALAASGCGGSGSGDGAAAARFCSSWSAALSAKLSTCARASAEVVAASGAAADRGCGSYAGAVTAGRAGFDEQAASRCLAAIDALECGGPAGYMASTAGSSGPVWPGVISQCEGVVTGRIALGVPCYSVEECASGYCDMTATCPGTCVPFREVGQSCGQPGGLSSNAAGPVLLNTCAPGLACAPASGGSGSACTAPSGVGGPCPCQADLYCDSGSGTCQVPKTSGACGSVLECAKGWLCTGSECRPAGVLGDPCDPGGYPAGAFACAPGYACDPATRACVVAPAAGESCAVDVGGTQYYLACAYGTELANRCTCLAPPKPDGATCATDAECVDTCDPVQHRCIRGAGACAL